MQPDFWHQEDQAVDDISGIVGVCSLSIFPPSPLPLGRTRTLRHEIKAASKSTSLPISTQSELVIAQWAGISPTLSIEWIRNFEYK